MAEIGMEWSGRRGPAISIHEARVFVVLHQNAGKWLSSHEIAAKAPGVAERTIRAYTAKYSRLGIVDVARVFPGHRYRLKQKAADIDSDFFRRIMEAVVVFGLEQAMLGTDGQG